MYEVENHHCICCSHQFYVVYLAVEGKDEISKQIISINPQVDNPIVLKKMTYQSTSLYRELSM